MRKDEDLPPPEYPGEPYCDRWYRKHIVPLLEQSAKVTAAYLALRSKHCEHILSQLPNPQSTGHGAE